MSQNNSPTIHLGIDVAKDELVLDAHRLPKLPRAANTPAGHRQILRALQRAYPKANLHLILEATGGYEQPLVEALRAAQIPVSVVMPGRVRKFAQALGKAKTDPIDATVLSTFGAVVQPPPTKALSETEQQLRELSRRRRQLQQMHTQELNRDLTTATCPILRRTAKAILAALQKQLAALESALRALRTADPTLDAKVTTLCSIDGVGPTTALATLAAVPELGTLNRHEVASLAGLAPHNRDSGPSSGRRFIGGGRPEARHALYMAAVCAARCNSVLQPLYQRLRDNGKPAKLALTALMRQLLVHMNSKLKNLSSPLPS
jgi:transposase